MYTLKINNQEAFSHTEGFSSGITEILSGHLPRIYVFAIGGSGARVLTSLTMLCATGLLNGFDIVPVLFDFDEESSCVLKTKELLILYSKIQKIINGKSNIFWGSSIKEYVPEFEFSLHQEERSVIEKYNLQDKGRTPDLMDLAESLCGDDLKIKSNVKKPNILRLKLGNIDEYSEFNKLIQRINPDDRIVVVGSSIGVTSSAIIYEITRAFKTTVMRKALVLLLPESNEEQNDYVSLQSNEYMSNAGKEMLRYYEAMRIQDNYDAVYYVSLGNERSLYEGSQQINSIGELVGSLAVYDFAKKQCSSNKEQMYYSLPIGLEGKITLIDFMRNSHELEAMKDLVRFACAVKFIKDNEKIKLPSEIRKFGALFCQWVDEMSRADSLKFEFVDFECEELHNFIKGVSFTRASFWYKIFHFGKGRPLFSTREIMKKIKFSEDESLETCLGVLAGESDLLTSQIFRNI